MELRRRHVIIAAVAAFIGWGHATHWVPSIRWIPYSFFAGAIATIVVLFWAVLTHAKKPKHVDFTEHYGPSHVKFIEPGVWEKAKSDRERKLLYISERIYPESPKVSSKFDRLLGLVLRDFVTSWYGHISSQPTFSNEVDRAIRMAATSIEDRLADLDFVAAIMSRLVPIITSHLHDFYEAERAVRGTRLTRNVTESEGLDMAIASKYRQGKLHPAASLAFADTTIVGQQYLKGLVVRLMPKLLPPEMLTSSVVNVLTKELVSCAVLAPVLRILGDPDIWHQILDNYGRTVLQERKSVRKLRQALDEHATQAVVNNSPKGPPPTPFPKLHPTDSERKFEKWIRAIRRTNTLSDARRFRSEVAIQLRKESMVENQDAAYLKRLEHGKRMLDKRIAQLGAGTLSGNSPKKTIGHRRNTPSQFATAGLRDVLYNASGLSYFMEFMDRQNLMRLVQFWIVVDGIRNPLEDEDHLPDQLPELSGDLKAEKNYDDPTSKRWTTSDRGDIAQINEAYLSKPEIANCTTPVSREYVKAFLRAGKNATDAQYLAARRAVLSAQSAAFQEMLEPHFENFKQSDLWMKFLASEDVNAQNAPQVPEPVYEPMSSPIPKPTRSAAPRTASGVNLPKHHHQIQPDLRRAVVSASDIRIGHERKPLFDDATEVRHSFESNNSSSGTGTNSRPPLFDDDVDSEPLTRSVHSLDSDQEHFGPGTTVVQDPKVVDAMQEALNSIMEADPEKDEDLMRDSMELPPRAGSIASGMSTTSSQGHRQPNHGNGQRQKPSIASLGLVEAAPSRRGVFEDDLFGEEIRFPEDDKEESDSDEDTNLKENKKDDDDDIHEAAPGDLGLAEAIDALTLDIEKLVTQESIVDSLTNKAELTNNAAELRILRKSKASLQREINRKELQRQQYIVQESDSSLFGRATVSIKSIMTGTAEDGKEFAMYIIEVTRQAGEAMPAASWVVARRYSAFHELQKRLKSRYPQTRHLDFPRRQMPVLNLQRDFLEKRRVQLEKYLRALLEDPAICRSRELRSFLSQQQLLPHTATIGGAEVDPKDFVTRIYNSVTDGMEEFLGNIPVLDQLSLAGQNLITAATTQLSNTSSGTMLPSTLEGEKEGVGTSAEAEAELARYAAASALIGDAEPPPFVKPLCDLFLEAFELNRENNWLRGRAVVFVLQQLLGGTVERKVRENLRSMIFSEDAFCKALDLGLDTIWPGGGPRFAPKPRTPQEKTKSRKEAGVVLASLVPELFGSVVGRANAQGAARRVLSMLNNERLNTHLVYTLFDEIISIVFGEGIVKP